MSDSPLATLTLLSPHFARRTHAIDTITVHHAACAGASAADIGRVFQSKDRRASSNYGIGTAGEIALFVPEDCRAFTSSSSLNDGRAVTIEVANCGGAPDWPVSEAAFAAPPGPGAQALPPLSELPPPPPGRPRSTGSPADRSRLRSPCAAPVSVSERALQALRHNQQVRRFLLPSSRKSGSSSSWPAFQPLLDSDW